MNKIKAIVKREYLTKVKKKSFIILTLSMPLIMLLFMALPFLMNMIKVGTTHVVIFDETGLFTDNISGNERVLISFLEGDIEVLKSSFTEGYDALLHIPNFDLQYP